jgi:hypothetical protein
MNAGMTGRPSSSPTLPANAHFGWGETQLLAIDHQLLPGIYRCTFDTLSYYAAKGQTCFYPEVPIIFVRLPGPSFNSLFFRP